MDGHLEGTGGLKGWLHGGMRGGLKRRRGVGRGNRACSKTRAWSKAHIWQSKGKRIGWSTDKEEFLHSSPSLLPSSHALQLDWSQQQHVEAAAPSHLQLPTGSTVPIDYGGPQPKARVKLQEVFGLADTPLLGGRGVGVPLLLELLSPAGRPLQVRGAGGGGDGRRRAGACSSMSV